MSKDNNCYLNEKVINKGTNAGGCKYPDEAYINESKKYLYIIEKKFQQCKGSVCEKIQTGLFKKEHYSKLFLNYKIIYIYCLSDWFKLNCKSEIDHLNEKNIPIFWGNDINYKNSIIEFIHN